MKYISVAIDGPAGAGKSTIAKKVASEMQMVYVDTGAMYRAMAYYYLNNCIDITNEESVVARLDDILISIEYKDGVQHVILNGEDVTGFIRTQEIGSAASTVSTIGSVRKKLVELQQKLAKTTSVIMDGRDIGSVVLPNADLKIYLTASVKERAKRRYNELIAKGLDCDISSIEKEIEERDYRDTHRENSPLICVDDAVIIDSSDMTADEVTSSIMDMVKKIS